MLKRIEVLYCDDTKHGNHYDHRPDNDQDFGGHTHPASTDFIYVHVGKLRLSPRLVFGDREPFRASLVYTTFKFLTGV